MRLTQLGRVVLAGAGITLCLASVIQAWWQPAFLLYTPGVALIVTALHHR